MTNGHNNLNVGYSEICFFESVLLRHTSVSCFTRKNDIQFLIERIDEMPTINAVLVSQYRLGEAFAYSVIEEFPGVNAIVNNGNWNAVALNQQTFKKNTGVDVLQLQHFLGALNNPSFGR